MSRREIERWIQQAEFLRSMDAVERLSHLTGKVVATLFYEPSTRTRLSFESAVIKLGGHIVGAENAKENTSAKKGETLEDVFRIVGAYADAIVIRHSDPYAMIAASRLSPVPIINAGSGSGEHPTQALLDVYTIWRELRRLDDLHVVMLGDLKYGRTVHSLLHLLTCFRNIRVTLLHPTSLGLPIDLFEQLRKKGLALSLSDDLQGTLAKADIVYQTRIQRERITNDVEANDAGSYRIGPEQLAVMRSSARILHPLPRVDELDPEIDPDPRAAYFRQAENGLYMRMAVLDDLLGHGVG